MSLGSRLKSLWLSCFAKPDPDRPLLQMLAGRPLRKVLEIGIGDGQRTLKLIKAAQRRHPRETIGYVGIDPFELGADVSAGLTLKQAHRLLRPSGARCRLIPGDPHTALVQWANCLAQHDVAIISSSVPHESLSKAWYYLPRTLAFGAVVLWADDPSEPHSFRVLPALELKRLAQRPRVRRAA